MAPRLWLARLRRALSMLVLCVLAASAAAAAIDNQPGTILVLGDSLSAEYGLARGSGWVALLGERLRQEHPDYSVENASISGETTSGGLTRLPALLTRLRPRVVIIELGANDGLRGLALDVARANLQSLVHEAQKAGARVVLVGMDLPPNYGTDFTRQFSAMFEDVAKQNHIALVPHFLADIGADRDLFQADGLHPTAQVQPHLRDRVWEQLQPLLQAHRQGAA